MAKQLNVNLAFTADASQAKAAMNDLQNQLNKIAQAPAKTSIGNSMAKDIQEASLAAQQLSNHLNHAINTKTGTLDFAKLNQSIKQSGMTLSQYGQKLQAIGPEGQAAFMSLANAVSQSEIPIRRSNTALNQMLTTLKNTARWQISSSILHGFMGSVQSAYGYAQDLNESLNNIRIVTGQNIDQMAKFAEQANKAAKALSTTTTEYTDASLIYYQQGLDDAQVAQRTEVTIKMANAAGQSAQIVSDQLTAVWNNFYDGSQSLEHYADVMTALGAKTASSTDEIAGGLEKFAAIADTIGLSYEYAASALATITANTRQSEDVVGTALKTIFARIQGLNLGETLDDGTTLNKYSEALSKIGVSIYDQAGGLKSMDAILDEMGSKWEGLNKDQQVALAQTVAGVRQYNQLISLMDNWNNGDNDSFQANLNTSYNAAGTLDEQADIYAESWEAARDRVTAAAESIYQSLIDDDMFIGILNGFEKILNYIDLTIDSLGGLEGVLFTVGAILTKTFSQQMAQGIRNMAYNIQMSTGAGRLAVQQQKEQQMSAMADTIALGHGGYGSEEGKAAGAEYKERIKLQAQLAANVGRMSEQEIEDVKAVLDIRKQISDQVIKAAQAQESAKNKVSDADNDAKVALISERMEIEESGAGTKEEAQKLYEENMKKYTSSKENLKASSDTVIRMAGDYDKLTQAVQRYNDVKSKDGATDEATEQSKKEVDIALENLTSTFEAYNQVMEKTGGTQIDVKGTMDQIATEIAENGQISEESAAAIAIMQKELEKLGDKSVEVLKELGLSDEVIDRLTQGYREGAAAAYKFSDAQKRGAEVSADAAQRINEAKGYVKDFADRLAAGANVAMSFASVVTSISGAVDTLTNPDLSGWEKFLGLLNSGSMALMMSIQMISSLNTMLTKNSATTAANTLTKGLNAVATYLNAKAEEHSALMSERSARSKQEDTNETNENTAATVANTAAQEKNNKVSGKGAAGTGKQIQANNGLKKSFSDLKSAGSKWFSSYKAQIGGAGLIAAGLAIAIGTITIAVNQYNDAANNLAEAQTNLQNLTTALEDAKSAYQDFANTIDSYKDLRNSIDELTEGTIEYEEAVFNANIEAQKLLAANKSLQGKYTVNPENGLIVIDDDALAELKRQELSSLGKIQAATLLAENEVEEAKAELDRKNLKRDLKSYSSDRVNAGNTAATTGAGIAAGAAIGAGAASMITGAIAGSVIPVVGTAIGAAVGLIGGAIATAVAGSSTNTEEAALDSIAAYYDKHGESMFATEDAFRKVLEEELKINDSKLVDSLVDNMKAVQELTQAERDRLEFDMGKWKMGFGAYNAGNVDYTEAENKTAIDNMAYEYAHNGAQVEGTEAEVAALWEGSNKDFWAAYLAEVLGDENIDPKTLEGDNYRITNTGGGAVTIEKRGADGVSWEEFTKKNGLDEDDAAEQLVKNRLMAGASEEIPQFINNYNDLVDTLKASGIESENAIDKIINSYTDLTGNTGLDLSKDVLGEIDYSKLPTELAAQIQAAVEKTPEIFKDQDFADYFNGLTEEQQQALLLQMEIDDETSQAEIDKWMKEAQSYIDSKSLSAKIEITNELEGLIGKDSKTSEDWTQIREMYESGDYEKPFVEFMQMTKQEQLDYLEKASKIVTDNQADVLETSVEVAKDRMDNAASERDATVAAAEEKKTVAREEIDNLRVDKASLISGYSAFETALGITGMGQNWKGDNMYGLTNVETSDENGYFNGYDLDKINEIFQNATFLTDSEKETYSQLFTQAQNVYDDEGYYNAEAEEAVMAAIQSILDNSGYEFGSNEYVQLQGNLMETFVKQEGDNFLDLQTFGGPLWDLISSKIEAEKEEIDNQITNKNTEIEGYDDEINTANTKYNTAEDTYIEQLQRRHQLQQEWENEVKDSGLDLEEYETYKDLLAETNPKLAENEEGLHKVAVANKKMEKGVKTLSSNWDKWNKVLKSESLEDVSTILPEVNEAVQDVLGIDNEDFSLLPPTFVQDNLDLVQDVVNGVEGSVEKLRTKAGESILMTIDGVVDPEGNIDAGIMDIHNAINSYDDAHFEVGVALDPEDEAAFYASCQGMINAAGMTQEQASAYFANMGYNVEFDDNPQTVQEQVVEYRYSYDFDDEGNPTYRHVEPVYRTQEMTIDAPTIKTITPNGTYGGEVAVNATPPKTAIEQKTGGNKSKKEKKDPKRDIERYHTITKEIEDLNRELSRVEANKEQAFGKAKLPFIKEELATIEKLIEKNKQYQAQIKQMADYDWSQISAYGFIDANADGILDNWVEVQERMMAEYNAAVEKFNKDGDEETFEAAEKRYNDFLELVEQYEETQKALEDAIDEGAELERRRISKELEEITTEVDFEIEIKQRDLDRLERIVDRLSRNTNNMIEIIDKLGEQVGAYGDQSQWYITGIQKIQQNAAEEGRELTDEEQRKIWEYQDALEEINDALEDIVETVENSLLEEFERWNSEIDENIDRFNTYSSSIEHYINIIKLSGRATADSMMLTQLMAQKTSIAMEKLNASYDKYQANLKAQQDVKAKLDLATTSGSDEDKEYWQKQYDEITKAVEQSHDEVLASWEDALQAAADQFEFTIEQTVQKLKDSISEFGLDGLADRYEKTKTLNEQYLSDLEKEYELNKLIRQVEGSIDDTDNLNAKRELVKLLDKINEKTAKGVELSKYDLDYMTAEYELELAKLALEEARNAKTSVRLQRGDDGNYSYVYTADQEEIAKAEQNYEDKLYALKELSVNHIQEMSDLIIQNEQDLMDALAAVDREKFETEEAYQAELNRIAEYYYARDTYLRTELNKAVQNMGIVYGDTIIGQLESCSTWEKAQETLKTNTNEAITTMSSAWTTWKTNTETAMQQVGTSSQTLTTTIQTDAQQIASATTSLAGTINTQTEQMKTYISSLIQKIWEWRDAYLDAIRQMQNTNSSFSSNIAFDPNADYSALMSSVEYGSELYNIYKGFRDQKLNDSNYTGNAGAVATTARIDAFLAKGLKLSDLGYKYYTDIPESEWIKLVGFKTGGYTGEWGPEGKLAYLHQKELVLNENDTANLLNAVEIIRSISKQIDKQAEIAALSFAQKATSSTTFTDGQTYQVEQDVTIHAEFPNATDQNEIKEAILGLVNYTAQYVAQR